MTKTFDGMMLITTSFRWIEKDGIGMYSAGVTEAGAKYYCVDGKAFPVEEKEKAFASWLTSYGEFLKSQGWV